MARQNIHKSYSNIKNSAEELAFIIESNEKNHLKYRRPNLFKNSKEIELLIFKRIINKYNHILILDGKSVDTKTIIKGRYSIIRRQYSKTVIINSLVIYILKIYNQFRNTILYSKEEIITIVNEHSDNSNEKWNKLIIYLEKSFQDKNKNTIETSFHNNRYGKTKLLKDRRRGAILSRIPKLFNNYSNIYNTNENTHVIYPLLYATSRNPIKDNANNIKNYGNDSIDLSYGKCIVKIEKSNKLGGSINSNPLVQTLKNIFTSNNSNTREVLFEELEHYNSYDDFKKELKSLYKTTYRNEILVFIHGYNSSFQNAAISVAQLAYDIKFPGVTSFYSWASQDKLSEYMSDEDTSEISGKYLYKYLTNLYNENCDNKIHIISHSMGNRILLNTLRKIKENDEHIKFGHIVLAAPDLNKELFEEYSKLYTKYSEMATLYISEEDKAVKLSKNIHDSNRLGISPPVTVQKGIDTINICSKLHSSLWELGHSYYKESEDLLRDINSLVVNNIKPIHRTKLLYNKKNNYWQLNID